MRVRFDDFDEDEEADLCLSDLTLATLGQEISDYIHSQLENDDVNLKKKIIS